MPDPTGLVYWFSANVGITAEDEFITEWRDQSGRDAHATQAVAERRPKLGTFAGSDLPALVFDGVDDYLDLPSLDTNFEAGLTFFCVAQAAQDSLGSAMVALSNGVEIDDLTFQRFDDAFSYEVGREVTQTESGTFALQEPRLLEVVHTADSTVSLFMNGIGMARITVWGPLTIPATIIRTENTIGRSLYEGATPWFGEIAEILLYSRPLKPSDRKAVESYLAKKWNCCD